MGEGPVVGHKRSAAGGRRHRLRAAVVNQASRVSGLESSGGGTSTQITSRHPTEDDQVSPSMWKPLRPGTLDLELRATLSFCLKHCRSQTCPAIDSLRAGVLFHFVQTPSEHWERGWHLLDAQQIPLQSSHDPTKDQTVRTRRSRLGRGPVTSKRFPFRKLSEKALRTISTSSQHVVMRARLCLSIGCRCCLSPS